MIRSFFAAPASVAVLAVALAGCADGGPVEPRPSASRGQVYSAGAKMVGCMTGRGWQVGQFPDGSWGAPDGIPAARADAYDSDARQCAASFGLDKSPPPVTREIAEAHFAALTATSECLRGRGYEVPDPPQRERSVASMLNSGDPLWDPYEKAARAVDSPTELDQIYLDCPQP